MISMATDYAVHLGKKPRNEKKTKHAVVLQFHGNVAKVKSSKIIN